MSKQSEAVKTWRRRCKERIIFSMGGACCICNYNRCPASLALHHLDPSKKDISFSTIRANPKNWQIIVQELRKCVLVCHNCHSEIHAGFAQVPPNAPMFDESLADYKFLEKKIEILTPCPQCGNLKKDTLKYCSSLCRSQSQFKVDWTKVNLVEELKNKSVVKLASELGCSDSAIHKRMKKIGLK